MDIAGDYDSDRNSYSINDELYFFCSGAVCHDFRKPLFQTGSLSQALITGNCDLLSTGIF